MKPFRFWCMLVFLKPSSRGVSSPELPSELDNVMSDSLDVLQMGLNSGIFVIALAEVSCEIEKRNK